MAVSIDRLQKLGCGLAESIAFFCAEDPSVMEIRHPIIPISKGTMGEILLVLDLYEQEHKDQHELVADKIMRMEWVTVYELWMVFEYWSFVVFLDRFKPCLYEKRTKDKTWHCLAPAEFIAMCRLDWWIDQPRKGKLVSETPLPAPPPLDSAPPLLLMLQEKVMGVTELTIEEKLEILDTWVKEQLKLQTLGDRATVECVLPVCEEDVDAFLNRLSDMSCGFFTADDFTALATGAVVVAGGSVSFCLSPAAGLLPLSAPSAPPGSVPLVAPPASDIDIFVLDEAELGRVFDLFKGKAKAERRRLWVVQHYSVWTLVVEGIRRNFQVVCIHKRSTVSGLVCGFDLDYVQCAYSNQRVWATPSALIAHRTKITGSVITKSRQVIRALRALEKGFQLKPELRQFVNLFGEEKVVSKKRKYVDAELIRARNKYYFAQAGESSEHVQMMLMHIFGVDEESRVVEICGEEDEDGIFVATLPAKKLKGTASYWSGAKASGCVDLVEEEKSSVPLQVALRMVQDKELFGTRICPGPYVQSLDRRDMWICEFKIPVELNFIGTLPLGQIDRVSMDGTLRAVPRVLLNLPRVGSEKVLEMLNSISAAVCAQQPSLPRKVQNKYAEMVQISDRTEAYKQIRNVRVAETCTLAGLPGSGGDRKLCALEPDEMALFETLCRKRICFRCELKWTAMFVVSGRMCPELVLHHLAMLQIYDC